MAQTHENSLKIAPKGRRNLFGPPLGAPCLPRGHIFPIFRIVDFWRMCYVLKTSLINWYCQTCDPFRFDWTESQKIMTFLVQTCPKIMKKWNFRKMFRVISNHVSDVQEPSRAPKTWFKSAPGLPKLMKKQNSKLTQKIKRYEGSSDESRLLSICKLASAGFRFEWI